MRGDRSAVLMLLFAASMIGGSLPTSAALAPSRGLKNVTFVVGNRKPCPIGTATLQFADGTPANLNQGVPGASRIRGCLTYTSNPQEMLRGMRVVKNNQACSSEFYKVPTNLNSGVGGTPRATRVYLCLWKATGSSSSPSQVMTDMRVVINSDSCPTNMTGAVLNLNDRAGGARLTLCKSILPLAAPPSSPSTPEVQPECGTPAVPLSEQNRAQLASTELYLTQEVGLSLADTATFRATVQVIYHVIHNGSTLTNLSDGFLVNQTDVLNRAYMKAGFSFVRVHTNRILNPTLFEALILNCSVGGISPIKAFYHKGDSGVLNVYIKDLGEILLGRSTFPWDYTSADSGCSKPDRLSYDGIWLRYNTLPGVAPSADYNLGATLVHEAGHWLGLYHTFQGNCTPDAKGGDEISDTFPSNRFAKPRFGNSPCDLTMQTCADLVPTYKEPLAYGPFDAMQNYMEYSAGDETCYSVSDGFTSGQIARMRLAWQTMRQCANYTAGTISGKGVKNCGPERWLAESEARCAQMAKEISDKQGLANTAKPCACGVLDADTLVNSSSVNFNTRPFIRRNLYASYEKDWTNKRSCKFSFDLTCCFSIKFGGLGLAGDTGACLTDCPVRSPCQTNRVCASGVCSSGRCTSPSCEDGVLNGDESDVDCGGSTSGCKRCGADNFCRSNDDCSPGSVCSEDKVCSYCFDNIQNFGEEKVDCGGPSCAPCQSSGSAVTLGKLTPPTAASRMGESLAAVGPPQAAETTVLASAYAKTPDAVAGVVFRGPDSGQIVGPLGFRHDGVGAVDLDASGKIALLTSMYPENNADRVGIFRNEVDNTWTQVARPSRTGGWDSTFANTGRDAAMSADGRTVAVYTSQGVFVLTAVDGIDQPWQEQALLTHPTQKFGLSWPLALSRNAADTLLVSSAGGVLVYMRQGPSSQWSVVQNITSPVSTTPGGRSLSDHSFGESIALSDDGSAAAVGQVHWDIFNVFHSAVHIFKRQPSSSRYDLVSSLFSEPEAAVYAPSFGSSVALSADGTQLLVGAERCCDTSQTSSGRGAVVYFALEGGAWKFKVRVDPPTQDAVVGFGTSVAVAGGFGFVGAPWAGDGAGAVYYWQLA